MTNQEILQKAIEKAIGNGFEFDAFIKAHPMLVHLITDTKKAWIESIIAYRQEAMILFDRDFAKAFWGNGRHGYTEIRYEVVGCEECKLEGFPPEGFKPLPCWQFHLQQMVISEDPIKYLEQFI